MDVEIVGSGLCGARKSPTCGIANPPGHRNPPTTQHSLLRLGQAEATPFRPYTALACASPTIFSIMSVYV